MVALLPFCALQNITKVSINGAHLEKEATILENVQQVLERKIPFELLVKEKGYWSGSNIRDWMISDWDEKS
jgi:hypothetical protein